MGGKSSVFRSIDDEILSSDIQGRQMECESCVIGNIIDERHSWDIQADLMEGGSGVT